MSRTFAFVALAVLPSLALAAKPKRQSSQMAQLVRPALTGRPAWKAPVPSKTETASGLSVVVLPRHELPLVTLTVVVRAGSALDPAGHAGLAAAVASMLQDGGAGGRTAPALADALATLGDELHVDCDPDGVHLQLTVLSRHVEAALAILADLLVRPRFDEAEWSRARARRIAEVLKLRDEPRHIADLVMDRVLYGEHPYGAPVLGTPTSIEALSAADLRAFHAAHYGPRTTSLMLVGDVDPRRAAALVERAFTGWSSHARPPAPPRAVPVGPARFVLVDRPGAPQSEVRVGHVGIARASADYAPASVLSVILGGSFTSRLVQNLREKHGYTYGASAHFELLDAPGPFVVRSAVRTDVTASALREIVAELAGIRAPLTSAELSKGRALVESDIVDAFSVGRDASLALAELVEHGLSLDSWSRLPAALAPLEPASLARVAARLFHPEALTIVVVGDRSAIEPSLRALPFGKALEIRDVDGNLIRWRK